MYDTEPAAGQIFATIMCVSMRRRINVVRDIRFFFDGVLFTTALGLDSGTAVGLSCVFRVSISFLATDFDGESRVPDHTILLDSF